MFGLNIGTTDEQIMSLEEIEMNLRNDINFCCIYDREMNEL